MTEKWSFTIKTEMNHYENAATKQTDQCVANMYKEAVYSMSKIITALLHLH